MVDIASLKAANARRWGMAKPTRNFVSIAKSLVAAKQRYITVQNRTGVPWFVIAVIHEREASQRWDLSLAQGDPWSRVSVHVPAGRGPFRSWEEAAVDALARCAPYAARNTDWSSGGTLTLLEQYNGLGYAARGLPSPYVWAGTDQYKIGKFTSDGKFSPTTVDIQPGCAGLLIAMQALDPTITVGSPIIITPTAPLAPDMPDPPAPPPSIAHPAKGSIGAFIASILTAIFKRSP